MFKITQLTNFREEFGIFLSICKGHATLTFKKFNSDIKTRYRTEI